MPLLANGRTGVIPLPHSTPLIFGHVSIPKKLIIETGASSIQWEYVLNTNIIPTYGGEVGQILSATVEAMKITGQTKNNNQLKEIYDWFLQYMQLAGLHNREEQAIKFSYPERGWEFYIQVNQAPNFQYNRDIIATPWEIQAEIVADNDLNYLSGYTMSLVGEAVTFDPSLYDIGFNVEQPQYQPNFGANLANNYQSLLGAWATGDFAHWGFQALNTPQQNALNPDAASIFQKAFGTDFIAGKNTGSSPGTGGGAFAYSGPQNPSTQAQIAQDIFFSCENANNIPGVLGITIALIETGNPAASDPGLNPNARNSAGYMGLFQTQPSGIGGSAPHASQLQAAFNHRSDPVTKWYPSGMQISDFVWWSARASKPAGARQNTTDVRVLQQWAISIQGVGGNLGGNPRYGDLNQFAQFYNAAKTIANRVSAGNDAGSVTARKAVEFAVKQIGKPYIWGGTGPRGFDCSGLCEAAYAAAGKSIPRTSETQWAAPFQRVPQGGVRQGDLVYFDTNDGQAAPSHVVISSGAGWCIAAPSPGRNVQRESLLSLIHAYGWFGANRPSP